MSPYAASDVSEASEVALRFTQSVGRGTRLRNMVLRSLLPRTNKYIVAHILHDVKLCAD